MRLGKKKVGKNGVELEPALIEFIDDESDRLGAALTQRLAEAVQRFLGPDDGRQVVATAEIEVKVTVG